MTMLAQTIRSLAAAGMLAIAAVPAIAADDIIDTAQKAGSFKTLVDAVKAAGLTDTLKGKGPFTVFAPTDDAFKKLPAGTLEKLLKPESKAELASILRYHVLSGSYPAARLQNAKAQEYTVRSVGGGDVLFDKRSGLTVDGAKVSKTDINASNGVIHVVDSVLLPAAVKRKLAVAAPKPAATAPAAPAAKADAPKADAAKAPATAAAPKADAPKAAPAAKADAPKADAPKADASKTDAGKAAAGTKPAEPAKK